MNDKWNATRVGYLFYFEMIEGPLWAQVMPGTYGSWVGAEPIATIRQRAEVG